MADNQNNNANMSTPDLSLEAFLAALVAQGQPGSTLGESQARTEAKADPGYWEKLKMGWEELKRRIRARLASLDQDKLKSMLLAAGLGVTAVAAVLLTIKLMPVGLTLLALAGVGLALHLWERFRWLTLFI